MKFRLDLGFEAQPRNRPLLRLAVLPTMRPALDPAGHWVPQTKPTSLLHTWRPHRQRPFALVLHLHQHQSSRNLHLQYFGQELVHTMLSITHHTRKRRSTSPRTTQVLILLHLQSQALPLPAGSGTVNPSLPYRHCRQ
jgi:hypothetical protein